MIENEAKVKIRLDIEKAKEQLGELQKQAGGGGGGDGGYFTEKAIEARIKERKRWAKSAVMVNEDEKFGYIAAREYSFDLKCSDNNV